MYDPVAKFRSDKVQGELILKKLKEEYPTTFYDMPQYLDILRQIHIAEYEIKRLEDHLAELARQTN